VRRGPTGPLAPGEGVGVADTRVNRAFLRFRRRANAPPVARMRLALVRAAGAQPSVEGLMKTAIPVIFALAFASGAAAEAKAANNPQELIDMEAAWAKAAVARDATALNRIVAADWQGQNQKGKIY